MLGFCSKQAREEIARSPAGKPAGFKGKNKMDPIDDPYRKADEASDLMSRIPAAFPIKRDMAALKARWEAKDPNVMMIDNGAHGGTRYELQFTKEQRAELKRAYLRARPPRSGQILGVDNNEFEADVFVRTVEEWAKAIGLFEAITPDNQKERKRAMESVKASLTKLDQALAELDSSALGYWYGHVVDALAKSVTQVSETENRLSSMLDNPLRAAVEAGEFRQELREILKVVVEATTAATDTLPKYDHTENDVRLKTAMRLERLIIEHGIPFNSSETGFAAICLRMMFELAGVEVEKVSYWLKKAEDHPDSYARFLQRLRDRG